MSTATLSPNGAASGLVLPSQARRRTVRVFYPGSAEAFAEAGYNPEAWQEDGVGFWAKVVASITGHDEMIQVELHAAFLAAPSQQTREDFYRELAPRVPEWGFAAENDAGETVAVPAPGEGAGNWQAFDLLPYGVGAWLVETVRTIHLPKRRPWARASTTALPTPTTPSPETTPPPSS